jgi:pSer/pThr/pTyr-binding forkhead associated (FHA) protein
MDQAKYYICESCMTPVPTGHKFCGRCGTNVPENELDPAARYFSDMQDPAKARLVLIRGEGMEGLSYHLKASQHVVGRRGQIEFPDDTFISSRHANLYYRDGRLAVRDEGSENGTYVRIQGSAELSPGDTFIVGDQLLRVEPMPSTAEQADAQGTYFYSSPKFSSPFRIVQIVEGGAPGLTVCARGPRLEIGREGCDLNFRDDPHISAKHCVVEQQGAKFTVTDLKSKNGIYVRLKIEQPLGHGDYLLIGRKLLRVELNA